MTHEAVRAQPDYGLRVRVRRPEGSHRHGRAQGRLHAGVLLHDGLLHGPWSCGKRDVNDHSYPDEKKWKTMEWEPGKEAVEIAVRRIGT